MYAIMLCRLINKNKDRNRDKENIMNIITAYFQIV